MGEITGIDWTDHTFNPWWGCKEVSPGCDQCYARELAKRFGFDLWGKGKPRRSFGDAHWAEPVKWNRDALTTFGRPARVFCASMADVMDDEASGSDRERLWDLINQTPNLIWQLLTKRPHRYAKYLPKQFKHRNVQLGTTAENQPYYDVRWPILSLEAQLRGLTSFISYEPAIGPLMPKSVPYCAEAGIPPRFPDWIIFGGESGNQRRPCNVTWAEELLKVCQILGIKFFMKQMAGRTPVDGKKAIPAHLQIQEFPEISEQ